MKNFSAIIKTMFAVFFLLQIIFYTSLYAESTPYIKLPNKDIELVQNEKFRIGNMSKVFTSTVILQMIDEHRIQLGTPISRFFPEIPNGHHISLGDLMMGKHQITDFLPGGRFYKRIYSDFVFEELTQQNPHENTLEFTDPNFIFMGMIVEKISGNTYTHEINERIIEKISLKNTFNYTGSPDEMKTQDSWSEMLNVWDLQSVQGAGSIVSTIFDMDQLKRSILNDHILSDKGVNILKQILLSNQIDLLETDTVSSKVK